MTLLRAAKRTGRINLSSFLLLLLFHIFAVLLFSGVSLRVQAALFLLCYLIRYFGLLLSFFLLLFFSLFYFFSLHSHITLQTFYLLFILMCALHPLYRVFSLAYSLLSLFWSHQLVGCVPSANESHHNTSLFITIIIIIISLVVTIKCLR